MYNRLKLLAVWITVGITPFFAFGVGWNSIVTTSATMEEVNGDCVQDDYADMDLFVNSHGLHLLVADFDGIKYRRLNSSGSIQSTSTISASGEFPNIIGDEDDLYILYYYVIVNSSPYITYICMVLKLNVTYLTMEVKAYG